MLGGSCQAGYRRAAKQAKQAKQTQPAHQSAASVQPPPTGLSIPFRSVPEQSACSDSDSVPILFRVVFSVPQRRSAIKPQSAQVSAIGSAPAFATTCTTCSTWLGTGSRAVGKHRFVTMAGNVGISSRRASAAGMHRGSTARHTARRRTGVKRRPQQRLGSRLCDSDAAARQRACLGSVPPGIPWRQCSQSAAVHIAQVLTVQARGRMLSQAQRSAAQHSAAHGSHTCLLSSALASFSAGTEYLRVTARLAAHSMRSAALRDKPLRLTGLTAQSPSG